MANTERYNTKSLSITLGSSLVLLGLLTILPAIGFGALDYSNVMFGSQPISKWITEIQLEKKTASIPIPVTYENPYLESTDLVFGTMTLDEAIHDVNAARLDTHEWVSNVAVLPGGSFFDSRLQPQQVDFDVGNGITDQPVSLQK